MVFPIVASPDPKDHDVNKSEFTLYQKAFMTYSGSVVLEKIFLKNDPTPFL
jgi:hypothetical protein